MRNTLWRTGIVFVLSILAVPTMTLGASAAAAPASARPSPVNEDSTLQASRLLDQMRTEALAVNDQADFLRSEFYSDLAWQTHAQALDHMADQVRKMDGALIQLQTMQKDVAGPQNQLISRVAPQVDTLTDELNGSIHYLERNHSNLKTQTYKDYIADLFHTSQALNQELQGAHRAAEF